MSQLMPDDEELYGSMAAQIQKDREEEDLAHMTLAEWADKQPYRVNLHTNGLRHIPDASTLVDRSQAWRLTDYLVWSVTGGTIWFRKRDWATEP